MPKTVSFSQKSQILALQGDPHFQDYQQALEFYWRGDSEAALTQLCKILQAAAPQHRFSVALYRLWLEILAENRDRPSLEHLAHHLQTSAWPEAWQTDMFALRGIILVELDGLEAAELMASTSPEDSSSSYWQEFRLKLAWRTGDGLSELQVLRNNPGVVDYMQWSLIALGVMQSAVNEQLDSVLAHVSKIYPQAPLKHLYKAQRFIDQGNFNAAKRHSQILRQWYPHHLDFTVLHGVVLLNLASFASAVSLLEQAQTTARGKTDPDLAALLSYAYRHLDQTSKNHERAEANLNKAETAYARLGISCRELRLPFQERQALPAAKTSNLLYFAQASRSINSWLVRVGSSGFFESLSADLGSLTYREQQLGRSAKINDLVFIASSHPWLSERLRVLTLYHVIGPVSTQASGNSTFNLKLVKRFSAPLTIALPNGELRSVALKRDALTREEPCLVFQLHAHHLGLINQEISELVLKGEEHQRWAKNS